MRNVFDQYKVPENRLTHALVACLSEDRVLLRSFLKQVAKTSSPPLRTLRIQEQSLPGLLEPSEEEAERRGLPDACIHDGESWALLIESKIESAATVGQLERHAATAARRGFPDAKVLVICGRKVSSSVSAGYPVVRWAELYRWASRLATRSRWAQHFRDYMEIAEIRMIEEGYLKNAALTDFSGIPFGRDNPYSYAEAKRVLGLAMGKLRELKKLRREIGADLEAPGRPAITGKDADRVWDFLPLRGADSEGQFTRFPHLTLEIHGDRTTAVVTIPNGVQRAIRRRLTQLGEEEFTSLLTLVHDGIISGLRTEPSASTWMKIVQRHYPTQRSAPIVDAELQFDLRTAVKEKRASNALKVKHQSEWLSAAYAAVCNRRSNLQLQVGAIFPHATCSQIRTERAIDLIANTWIGCKPLLDVLLGKKA